MEKELGNVDVAQVLVVDDNPNMRHAITIIVDGEQDLKVCGEANSIENALEQCQKLRPDLALIDISLKGEDGLELVRQLKECSSPVCTVVFSLHEGQRYIDEAREAGAHGYARKGEGPDELLQCLRAALNGQDSFPAGQT